MLALAGGQSLDIRGPLEVFALDSPQAQEQAGHEPLDDRACCPPTSSRSTGFGVRRPPGDDPAGAT
jgi:hypothetical protein